MSIEESGVCHVLEMHGKHIRIEHPSDVIVSFFKGLSTKVLSKVCLGYFVYMSCCSHSLLSLCVYNYVVDLYFVTFVTFNVLIFWKLLHRQQISVVISQGELNECN